MGEINCFLPQGDTLIHFQTSSRPIAEFRYRFENGRLVRERIPLPALLYGYPLVVEAATDEQAK